MERTSHESTQAKTNLSRRELLSSAAIVGAGMAITSLTGCEVQPVTQRAPAESPTTGAGAGTVPVSLNINGQHHDLQLDPRTTVLDALREDIGLTGPKKGCDHGQ